MWVSVRVQPLEGRKHGRDRIETSSGSIQPGNTRSHPWLVCSLENARPSRDIRNLPTHPSSTLLSLSLSILSRPCFTVTFLSFLLPQKEETTAPQTASLTYFQRLNGLDVERQPRTLLRPPLCSKDRIVPTRTRPLPSWTGRTFKRNGNGNDLLRFRKRSTRR